MPKPRDTTEIISFKANLYKIDSWTILRLPENASSKLPSRGQVIVEGTFNGTNFQTPLEPDGRFSHWFKVDTDLLKETDTAIGDAVELAIKPIKEWPVPELPADLQNALSANPPAYDLWQRITPMSRWEWIRWIRSTGKSETRKKRIDVAISKLNAGKRRPCCWNRNLCTIPEVSKRGLLLQPTPTAR